jgi:transcriptional regulator with XRE-family HTH domain
MRRGRLREAREAANLTQEQVAERVGVDRTTYGKWERGESTPAPGEERTKLAEAINVTLTELHAILSNMPIIGDEIPRWLNLYLAREQSATEVAEHQPCVIAGLAQTQDYAGAIARSVGTTPPSDEYVERTKKLRALRQQRIYNGELTYRVLQPEFSLHMKMGSTATMAAQLGHLVELGQLDNVTIQIVPYDRGQYEALRIGIFSLLYHPWAQAPSVHLEGYGGARIIDGPDEVAYFASAFEHGQRTALSPAASARLITEIANRWRQRDD